MRSDTVRITNDGAGIPAALAQAEAVAACKNLAKKDGVRLRLLAEEMTGMFRAVAGKAEADFWIEDDQKGVYTLHLTSGIALDAAAKEKLLSVSTTGENAAEKTFMGKMRALFTRAAGAVDTVYGVYDTGWYIPNPGAAAMSNMAELEAERWSLNQYRASLEQKKKEKAEEWDELEKSVVANLADEVEIFLRGRRAEMVITKKFA